MTAIIQALHPWAETWIPEELYGGLKGQSPAELHDLLGGEIATALPWESTWMTSGPEVWERTVPR